MVFQNFIYLDDYEMQQISKSDKMSTIINTIIMIILLLVPI